MSITEPQAKQKRSRHPIPVFRAYSWQGDDDRVIGKALRERRDRIAELLQINPSDVEGRWQRDKSLPPPSTKRFDFDRYMQLRRAGQSVVVPTIDVVLDELESICMRACAELINVDRRPSYAVHYSALVTLSKAKSISRRTIEQLDPRLLGILARHYPGGRRRFSRCYPVRTRDVRIATERALALMEKPKRGRPAVKQKTLVRFVQRLVSIYEGLSPNKAGRSVLLVPFQERTTTSQESGPFLELCELVFACLPKDVRNALLRSGANSLASAVRRALAT